MSSELLVLIFVEINSPPQVFIKLSLLTIIQQLADAGNMFNNQSF